MDKEQSFALYLMNEYISFLSLYGAKNTDFNLDIFVMREISKRYFKDVDRLHKYHGISRIDAFKIAGYTTYWISKLKPISVVNKYLYRSQSEFCMYINEIFAVFIATGRLLSISEVKNIRISHNFLAAFLYLLKFRTTSGDNLALMYSMMSRN